MPLAPLEAPSLLSRLDAPREPVTPDEAAADEVARPAFTDTISAAWRTQNEIGSVLAQEDIPDPYRVEDGFDSFDYVKGTEFEGDEDFQEVFNRRAADALRRQKERERADRRTLDASGPLGLVAEIGAGILSPTMLMPGGAVYRGVRGGYAVGRTALSVGTAAVAATAAQEAVLQATQMERTAAETGFALGASALLGGFVGGGAAALMSRGERRAAQRAVRMLTSEGDSNPVNSPFGASGGAAAVNDVGMGDLEIAGRAARSVASATSQLNPTLRLNTSPSQSARLFGQQLGENSLYQAGNDFGVTAGPSVERLASNSFHARIYQAEKALDEAYKTARKAGVKMSRVEFENAVGRAARRNDVGENEFVTRAAQAYRASILDPFKREAVSVRLLPEDVATTTADSYLHRMWDFQKLTAGEGKFKEIVRTWITRTLSDEAAGENSGRQLISGDIDETSLPLPPVPAGHVRFYHSGADYEGGPRWLSPSVSYVNYRPGLKAFYIDIPESKIPSGAFNEINRYYLNFEAPEELARGLKPILSDGAAASSSRVAAAFDLEGFVDIEDYANHVADLVYDKLTGRVTDGPMRGLAITLGPRGPLKERTFDIPDALVEDFLNNNIVEVGRRYSRLMSADVELTKRFGAVDMKEQRAKVADEYRALRERVQKAKDLDEIREITGKGFKIERGARKLGGGRTDERMREKALAYLAGREKADLRDLDGLRDLIRGTYGIQNADGGWNRISRAANQINYIRLMGGAVVASLGDIYRPAMVHGLLPFMRTGIRPLLTRAGREAVKMSVADAQRFGLVVERYAQGRLATYAEIGDPYRHGTAAERLLDNAARVGSRWNGILIWTDAMKGISSVLSQDRIIRGALGEGDDRFLAYLGVSKEMKARISQQIADHGEEIDGVWVANVAEWTDPEAARTYGAALGKDVDSVIVTRSVGDVPLFANTPTGRLLLQFKSFALASHQKVLMRGLQESPARFISGMVGMTAIGMLAAYARAWRGGKERFERFTEAAENPGYLIGEGLDLTGIFSLPMEAANMGEKILQTNVIKDPLKAMFPDKSQQGSSLRYQSRGVASALLGPSASLIDIASETAKLTALAASGEATDKQKERLTKQAVQLVPYYSYPGMREMINLLHSGN